MAAPGWTIGVMTMSEEPKVELSLNDLDHVTGGLDDSTKTKILDVMETIPVVGLVTHMARVATFAIYGKSN
jgi:hypothetical protein